MASLNILLENGLNLSDVVTTGSVLHINQDSDEVDYKNAQNESEVKPVDIFGEPVSNLAALGATMAHVDEHGYVKKKILAEGGGLPIHDGCSVSFAYSCYFEGQLVPFDLVPVNKPMVQDLNDNGLLPGLVIALKSMLVGETSIFLLSYKVMYGEMGIPPRIKPKTDCVVYIKLIKSTLTSENGKINFSEPNIFQRVDREVKLLYASGCTLFQNKNYIAAIQLFKKGVNMLHKCRLADEKEEQLQEKALKKIYTNLAICYNTTNKPLLACTACNELNRLGCLWNNSKALFQSAKALRMIGVYEGAEKRLLTVKKLSGETKEFITEYKVLMNAKQVHNKTKVDAETIKDFAAIDLVSAEFKAEVDELIKNYKSSSEQGELLLPTNLNSDEMEYVKTACIRENLFCNKLVPDEEENNIEESVSVVDLDG